MNAMHRLTATLLFLQILVFGAVPAFVSADTFAPADCGDLFSTDLVTEMTHEIESRIDGVVAATSTKELFTTRGTNTDPWVRNGSVWASEGTPLDFTGVSPWNSNSGFLKSGTLITPRHIAFANHFPITNGSVVAFIAADNTIVTRTLTAQADVGNDVQIGVLDSDVPGSIAFYPILSNDQREQYFGASDPLFILLDREEKALIRKQDGIVFDYLFDHTAPSGDAAAFSEELVGGDSGKPGFFVVDGQLIFAITTTSAEQGPFYGGLINEINETIVGLGNDGGYEVSTYDVSCFDYDNTAPEFSSGSYTYSLSEGASTGMEVGTPPATDDQVLTTLSYSILSGNASTTFAIDGATGEITLADQDLIDYDVTPSYTLVVQVEDDASSPLSATTSVTVNITTNDRPTVRFSSTASSVDESDDSVDVRIRLNTVYTKDVSVVLTSADGSASATGDYDATSRTIIIPEGDQTIDVTVNIADDAVEEDSETFTLQLSSPTKATLGAFLTHTVTITDNDEDSGGGGGGGGGSSGRGGGSSTPSVKELEAKIVQLKAVLTALLSGKSASVFSPSPTTSTGAVTFSASDGSFTRDLELGAVGEDVRSLQEFLNDQGYFVAVTGPGSHGNESTYFGPATQAALARFQATHGILPAAGRFGPTTRGRVIALCSSPSAVTNRLACL